MRSREVPGGEEAPDRGKKHLDRSEGIRSHKLHLLEKRDSVQDNLNEFKNKQNSDHSDHGENKQQNHRREEGKNEADNIHCDNTSLIIAAMQSKPALKETRERNGKGRLT